jgi:Cellulase M and related proteins
MATKPQIELIKKLSNANGVSGFEDEVVEIILSETQDKFDVSEDPIRNVYIERRSNTGEKPVIQIDAHSDEVGFIVQAIKPNGTIVFLNVGGWIASNAAAQRVRIKNRDGVYIPGIVASVPPHFATAQDHGGLDISDLVIDIGATSKEEVISDYKIGLGAPIVPDVTAEYNEYHNQVWGKGFDCRIGCAAVLGTLEALEGLEVDVDVIATITAQEEIGLRGAKIAASNVEPDIAIVFEGCPADDTFLPDYMIQTALEKGPMLRHFDVSMITNPRFQRYALDIAEKHGIPVQEAVRKGGGTNGAAISLYQGAPTIVIGIPVRFAHTPNCIISIDDYDNAVKLATQIIKELNEAIIDSF